MSTFVEGCVSLLSPQWSAEGKAKARAALREWFGDGESEGGVLTEGVLNTGKPAVGSVGASQIPLATRVLNWQRPPVDGESNGVAVPLTEGLRDLMFTGRVKPATPAAKMHANVKAWGKQPAPETKL